MFLKKSLRGSHVRFLSRQMCSSSSSSSSTIINVTKKKELLIVYHSRTGLARRMSEALKQGAVLANKEMGEELNIKRKKARDCSIDDVMAADGYIFCAPENLATLSGEMLEFFHRNYYHAFRTTSDDEGEYHEESKILGRPYGVAIAAGSDGEGAARHITRICTGWRLKSVAEPLIVNNGLPQTKANILSSPKTLLKESEVRCHEVGGLVAATLML